MPHPGLLATRPSPRPRSKEIPFSRRGFAPEVCCTARSKASRANRKGGGAPNGAPIGVSACPPGVAAPQLADAVHRGQVYAVCTLIGFGTARLPALHRGTCRCDPAQLRPRASWDRNGPDRSIPGQRAPRGPAVVPDGRVSEAARERSARPRAGAPLSLHLQDRIRNVPFDERDSFF
jgi:hypothetical protein